MNHKLLCIVVLTGCFVAEGMSQSTTPIPVYPGAKLVAEQEDASVCCDFTTTDALEKVLAFYESQLKTKPMDSKAFAAAYPAQKQQVQMLEQQLPPNFKYRVFVLQVRTPDGGMSPVLFEVLGTPQGVQFSIGDDALAGNDAQFARTWRERTGKLTEEERIQQEASQRQALEDKEQKERDARRAKEEPQYIAAMTSELVTLMRQYKVDLAPGLQCEKIQWQEGESSTAYVYYFTSPDDFKKPYDFYASRSNPVPITDEQGNGAGWSDHEFVHFWRTAEFSFDEALQIRVQELSVTIDGPKRTAVMASVRSPEVQMKLRGIQQKFESQW